MSDIPADSKWARDPRKPLPKPTVISVKPDGIVQPGTHIGNPNGPHHVAVRPTMASPPPPGQSDDNFHWSEVAAVADNAQTPR